MCPTRFRTAKNVLTMIFHEIKNRADRNVKTDVFAFLKSSFDERIETFTVILIMIWFYRLLFWPAFILAFPYYLKRMIKRGGYGRFWWHRIGLVPAVKASASQQKTLWIQAVSVGEVHALKPLIDHLVTHPCWNIYLTTTTSTGFQVARQLYGEKVRGLAYFPLNFWLFSVLAWRRIRPDMCILMESELWPEHLHRARRRKVPLLLVNARCSDRSFKRYKWVPFLTRWLLNHFDQILASTELDFQRLLELGAKQENTFLTGNLKLDCFSPESRLSSSEIQTLKESLGKGWEESTILLGASTWPGEETLLLECYAQALQKNLAVRLILVPRHAERRESIEALLKKGNWSYLLHSQVSHQKETPRGAKVYVVDTTGELKTFIQLADIVFVGNSLTPNRGGQTPIEAAAYGKAIVYGPNMDNFRSICQSLEAEKAAFRAKTAKEVQARIMTWLEATNERSNYAKAAIAWHRSHQGAIQKAIERIRPFLES